MATDSVSFPHPEWDRPDELACALETLRTALDESSANEAHDRFLWAIGNNHAGTFYPVVLAALPELERVLRSGSGWAQVAAMESLIDIGGSFVPETGYEVCLGHRVKEEVLAFLQSVRPFVASLAAAKLPKPSSASDLLELIDDQAA